MKKAIVVISSVLYLLLSTGIYISIHYCHNNFSDFKLYGNYDDRCCGESCGFSEKCCSFETISGKITQEHFSSGSDKDFAPKILSVNFFSFEQVIETDKEEIIEIFISDTSPTKDIPILNCSLTFYG